MTAVEHTKIVCDRRGYGCQREAILEGKIKDARSRARGLGWRRSAHPPMDICPGCVRA